MNQFGSADTKLKQLQIKMKECDSETTALMQEQTKLRRIMKSKENVITRPVQVKIE
jgi:hypothetical protein